MGQVIPAEAIEAAANVWASTIAQRPIMVTNEPDENYRRWCRDNARQILEAAAPHMRRTIKTAEELGALPVGTILLDRDGDDARKFRGGWRITIADLPAVVLHEPTP